jgi:GNAT superfamily N-acetyltransferase
MLNINIREAVIEDAQLILDFVKSLAVYEKAESEVVAGVEDIKKSIFSSDSNAHALICHIDDKPAGFAIYFYNYSTWHGKPGLYLEDLFIDSEYRGSGAGKALLKHLAIIAESKNCCRFEWSVLDWNSPAIDFYEALGAKPQKEWIKYRLDGNALREFAQS